MVIPLFSFAIGTTIPDDTGVANQLVRQRSHTSAAISAACRFEKILDGCPGRLQCLGVDEPVPVTDEHDAFASFSSAD